jgi:hypothetical protein
MDDRLIEWMLDPDEPLITTADIEWVICDRCRGEGILGGYPGVYTEADFAEDPDLIFDYMAHRRACEDCRGTGKVRELTDEAAARPEVDRFLRDYYSDLAAEAMERAYGC